MNDRELFIACGMYAFTDDLKAAWQELFDHFFALSPSLTRHNKRFHKTLNFGHGTTVLRDPALYFGQTCGYPLMTQLQETFTPFCTACFDVPGSSGKYYSSQIIVNADSNIDCLAQCADCVVAINNLDSNSGMNVLRYALACLGATPHFFSDLLISGSHLASVQAVAERRATVAAIDCVSFQLILDAYPGFGTQVRPIMLSHQTCGLPFVIPDKSPQIAMQRRYTEALQHACDRLSPQSRQCLHLAGFEEVSLHDYEQILDLEHYALEHGFDNFN